MRRLSAHYIFPISSPPIKNGIVEINDDGQITAVKPAEKNETEKTEFYNGILVPGFVNTHCHLELSVLKDKIEPHQEMGSFIEAVQSLRNGFSENELRDAIDFYDAFMQAQGIVAVGDICNTDHSFQTKQHSSIYYHSFVEAFGLDASQSHSVVSRATQLLKSLKKLHLNGSITIHSPYSVSEKLLRLIAESDSADRLSVHHLETDDERQLLHNHTGVISEFFRSRHLPLESLPQKISPTEYLTRHLSPKTPILFVHNTVADKTDLSLIKSTFDAPFLSVCASSNLFLHQQLPNLRLLQESAIPITIGTDSLASNTSLSILHELKILSAHFPHISLDKWIEYATLNGAKALGVDHRFGSFEIGKTPGINLVEYIDLQNLKLLPESQIKRLV